MNKDDIKILSFDIDGTLIPWGKKHVEKSTVEAIKQAKKNGCKVLISTGRIINFIQPSIFEEVDADYYVCVNGQIIYDKNLKPIVKHTISEQDINKLVELSVKLDIPLAFKWENNIVIYNSFNGFKSNYLVGENHDDALIDCTEKRDYHIDHGLPFSCFMCAQEEEVATYHEIIDDMVFVRPKDNAVEGYNSSYNKSTGILEVAKLFDLNLDNVMSFGDADNDVDMLLNTGVGVAMGNASEKAKKAADYITSNVDDDGIYNALRHYEII